MSTNQSSVAHPYIQVKASFCAKSMGAVEEVDWRNTMITGSTPLAKYPKLREERELALYAMLANYLRLVDEDGAPLGEVVQADPWLESTRFQSVIAKRITVLST